MARRSAKSKINKRQNKGESRITLQGNKGSVSLGTHTHTHTKHYFVSVKYLYTVWGVHFIFGVQVCVIRNQWVLGSVVHGSFLSHHLDPTRLGDITRYSDTCEHKVRGVALAVVSVIFKIH